MLDPDQSGASLVLFIEFAIEESAPVFLLLDFETLDR